MNKGEFKNLDSLRGIMAMYVTVVHFYILYTLNKRHEMEFTGLKTLAVVQLGQIFMTVFFVLSGFLITYILLIEKQKSNNLNFKRFYLRRAFRILPMYYLGVISMYLLYRKVCLGAELIHTELCAELPERAFYYFAMIPNWAHAIDKNMPHISNYWSIGAEEQFYLFWPLILYFSKNYLRTFYGMYFFYCLLMIGFVVVGNVIYNNQNIVLIQFAKLFDYTRFGAFAFGGVIAFYFIHADEQRYHKIHQFFILKKTQWFCLLLPFFVNVIPVVQVVFLKHLLVIPCCAILIYNMAYNEQSILKIDHKYLNYLGKTTYSLYILNQIVIDFAIKICMGAHIKGVVLIFVLTISLLLITSILCYEFIEKPFMKLRRYFG